MAVVAASIENSAHCALALNKLLSACGTDPDDVLFLLSIAQKCVGHRGILQANPIYRTIAESPDASSAIRAIAAEIVGG
jgi:hypothetical protein